MKRNRAARHGFTLVEILIALAILALVAVLAYRATAAMTEGEAQLAAEAQRWRGLDAFFARIEADARAAIPRSVRVGAQREAPWIAGVDARGNAALAFTRAGSEFAAEPGMGGQRIGYRLAGDIVEVLYWPQLDRAENATPAAYALVPGVASLRVGYFAGGRWIAQWPAFGESEVPRALRVELAFADGSTVERWITLQ